MNTALTSEANPGYRFDLHKKRLGSRNSEV